MPLAVGRACELVDSNQLSGVAAETTRRSSGLAVRLAPGMAGPGDRAGCVAAMVDELVSDGFIPRSKVRNELQDVRPFPTPRAAAGDGDDDGVGGAEGRVGEGGDEGEGGDGGGGGGGGGGGVGDAPPMLRMERAAMIYFGVPSYGVHVNGWVRDPDKPSSDVPWAMWVATRSMSKATYPGLFDQMVAGGQPSKISFDEK